ncbi:hypothetical protein NP493_62g00006 [Ridgeia piscesae]|uniref:Uncharacterized protein n=1 Tax=Ridgeia piscesae TaxID=27915 RepID=A0AAD9PAC2_RIDPI|nr:hypothetical protein NP493_62g00006 [Ridgeia piscesae]
MRWASAVISIKALSQCLGALPMRRLDRSGELSCQHYPREDTHRLHVWHCQYYDHISIGDDVLVRCLWSSVTSQSTVLLGRLVAAVSSPGIASCWRTGCSRRFLPGPADRAGLALRVDRDVQELPSRPRGPGDPSRAAPGDLVVRPNVPFSNLVAPIRPAFPLRLRRCVPCHPYPRVSLQTQAILGVLPFQEVLEASLSLKSLWARFT